jgi:hypothetical protein
MSGIVLKLLDIGEHKPASNFETKLREDVTMFQARALGSHIKRLTHLQVTLEDEHEVVQVK